MSSAHDWLTQLDPSVSFSFAILSVIYGLFGWRLVRYLAVADALIIGILLSINAQQLNLGGSSPFSFWPLLALIVVGLPWVAWRYQKWAAIGMGGVVGFLLVQLILGSADCPLLARILLGALGSGFLVAFHATLFRETSVFVTGLHGGCFCVAAIAASANSFGSVSGRFLYGMDGGFIMLPILAVAVSAVLILIQWTDLTQSTT